MTALRILAAVLFAFSLIVAVYLIADWWYMKGKRRPLGGVLERRK
jgi:hypothetical protein